jgi:hypothetical protein
MRVGKALVVAKIKVGFGAIVGDKHFPVLIGRHGARINVQVRIALLEGDFQTAAFEETTDGSGRNALSE